MRDSVKTIFPAILVQLTLAGCLVAADGWDDLARTPPMGWNSWNTFRLEINEDLVKGIADTVVEKGLKDAGYEYIVIDDGWQIDRDENGNIIVDPKKFPSGIKALADYVHSKGLKFGIYSDAGYLTCGGFPGSLGYEYQDARQYAAWGVDYLKYDWCNTGNQSAPDSYRLMRNALPQCRTSYRIQHLRVGRFEALDVGSRGRQFVANDVRYPPLLGLREANAFERGPS